MGELLGSFVSVRTAPWLRSWGLSRCFGNWRTCLFVL